MLTVTYDNSGKDVSCICVMKVGENLSYACLKMELGEQAELLYRALTEQDFKIKEDKGTVNLVNVAKMVEPQESEE